MSIWRQRRYYSYPSRWGTGKVHKQYYNPVAKEWVCLGHIRTPHGDTSEHYEGQLPSDLCKKCFRT